ncbi:MAG: MotA/TolQ/ExbB proton channel family protein [Clostridiales bacterium]|nr:MotA/TolQ/ExbB proton channel family protein [Clostridiales bacterium]
MGKKIVNMVLFLAVTAAGVGLTLYVGRDSADLMVYNFIFLAVMAVIYMVGLFGGMFQMNSLSAAFTQASQQLTTLFGTQKKADRESLGKLKGIFSNRYLDQKINDFTDSIVSSEEGIGEIEDYINEDELDIHVHRRLLDMVPDIFTSLGILGTFVGLVWGLKDFNPTDYSAMTSSVSALVGGIKVAFLTSIYGISFAVIYTYGIKSEYSAMTESLQGFLERFHALVIPTAENESRNLLVASQKIQTQAMQQMAQQFSAQMAESFEQVITPTFRKMNESLDTLTASVTQCQQDAVREIVDVFLDQMHQSFQMQFQDFNQALDQLKRAQKDNTEYASELFRTMSRQLGDAYIKQEHALKDAVREMGSSQKSFMNTANQILHDNQSIQQMQQQDYQDVVSYLKEAEKTSANFWVACNQTMQKYVETAADGMKKASSANKLSADLLKANRRIIEDFDLKMEEFEKSEEETRKTMEEVRRLLSEIAVDNRGREVYLSPARSASDQEVKELLGRIEELLETQGARQATFLEDASNSLHELSRASQKRKTGLFR